jgi:hypothetical protein
LRDLQDGLCELPRVLQIVEFDLVHNELWLAILLLDFALNIVQQIGKGFKAGVHYRVR